MHVLDIQALKEENSKLRKEKEKLTKDKRKLKDEIKGLDHV